MVGALPFSSARRVWPCASCPGALPLPDDPASHSRDSPLLVVKDVSPPKRKAIIPAQPARRKEKPAASKGGDWLSSGDAHHSYRNEFTGSAFAARAAGSVPERNAMATTIKMIVKTEAGSNAICATVV